jgi:hypothetical protein
MKMSQKMYLYYLNEAHVDYLCPQLTYSTMQVSEDDMHIFRFFFPFIYEKMKTKILYFFLHSVILIDLHFNRIRFFDNL